MDGTWFFPNMPTEEIFTTPHRDRADGIVHSALPLNYNGGLIEDFWVRFKVHMGGREVNVVFLQSCLVHF